MTNINLLPKQWYEEQQRRHARRISTTLVVCGVPLLLALATVWLIRDVHLRNAIDQEQERIRILVSQTSDMDRVAKQQIALQRELEERNALMLQLSSTHILALLVTCMPDELGLTHLMFDAPLPTLITPPRSANRGAETQAERPRPRLGAPSAVQLQVQGYALDDLAIARYVNQLGHQPLFHDVKLGMSKEVRVQNTQLHQFFLTLTVPMNRTFIVEMEE